MEDVVCRLCLSLITSDESQSLDTVSTDILKNIIPKLNLGISDNPKICQTCYKTMLRCYKFKTSCIREETKTEIKTNPDASQIDIEGPHIELYKDKCDLCSGNIDMESVSRFKLHKSNFNDMLDTCLPDWTRTRITFTCKTCLDNLLSYYKFIEDSIDVENKILNYCLILGMTEGKINIYEIYQHIVETSLCQSSMHIKEETIEMETDVVIKTEEVDIKDEEIASGSGTCSMDRHNRSSKILPSTASNETHAAKTGKKRPPDRKKYGVLLKKLKNPKSTRDIGIQVNPKDLIQTCNVAVQVESEYFDSRSVATGTVGGLDSEDIVSSSTEVSKAQQKRQTRISRKRNKEVAKKKL